MREKFKIRYILSDKASKQRNTDIKIYLKDFFVEIQLIICNAIEYIRICQGAFERNQKQRTNDEVRNNCL
jgi:hypothetical protein